MPVVRIDERPRIFLSKVQLSGFKSIYDLTVELQPGLNILIGKNGSGKSNFIEFINKAFNVRATKVDYNNAFLIFKSSDNHTFSFSLQKAFHGSNSVSDFLDENIEFFEKFTVDNQVIFDNSKEEEWIKSIQFKDRKVSFRGRLSLRAIFNRLGYQSIHPLYIRFNLPDEQNLNFLSLPGTVKILVDQEYASWEIPNTLNFLDFLFFNIELSYGDEYLTKIKSIKKENFFKKLKLDRNIKDNLKKFTNIQDIKFNDNINVYNDDKAVIIDNLKLDFKVNGNWLPWSQLSDGTKRLFYIISEVTNSRGLILIEEPELGVHPHQFNLVMNFLSEQAVDKQVIISTHSPKTLDHIDPVNLNSIIITAYSKDKGTTIKHLSSSQIKKAKRYITEVGFLSDYWMLSDLEK